MGVFIKGEVCIWLFLVQLSFSRTHITLTDETAALVTGNVWGWLGTGGILDTGTGDEAEGWLGDGDGDEWPNSESSWVFVSLLVESVNKKKFEIDT